MPLEFHVVIGQIMTHPDQDIHMRHIKNMHLFPKYLISHGISNSSLNIKYYFFQQVRGEIYEVDDDALNDLDVLEDHPNWYLRREEWIEFEAKSDTTTSSKVKCFLYALPGFKNELLKHETYDCYDAYGSHGKLYSIQYETDHDMSYIRNAVCTKN